MPLLFQTACIYCLLLQQPAGNVRGGCQIKLMKEDASEAFDPVRMFDRIWSNKSEQGEKSSVYVSSQGRRKVFHYVHQCTLAPPALRLKCTARWIFYAFILEDVFKACARKCVTLRWVTEENGWRGQMSDLCSWCQIIVVLAYVLPAYCRFF